MKRIFVFFTIFFVVVLWADAQKNTFKPELYIGAGGGYMFAKVDFQPKVSQVMKNGVVGGISAKYISEKYLGLLVEVNFAQRGWKESFDANSDYAYTRTLNYLEIPLMTHVYAGNKVRFIFNIGPQIGILLGSSSDMSQALKEYVDVQTASAEEGEPIPEQRYDEANKKFDYGIIAGTGLQFKTGIGDFDLEGRYYFGLGDVFNNTVSDYYSRSAHRVIEAKLTYSIKIF